MGQPAAIRSVCLRRSVVPGDKLSSCFCSHPLARRSALRCKVRASQEVPLGSSECKPSRRALVHALPVAVSGTSWAFPMAALAAFPAFDSTVGGISGQNFDLRAVLADGQPRIRSPGLSWSLSKGSKQVFFPPWLEGTWSVTAEFAGFYAPLGMRFTGPSTPGFTKASVLCMADAGASPVRYQVRYIRSKAEGGIVADREFNLESSMNAFLGRGKSVRSVAYDPVENPTRLAVVYSTPRKDVSELSEDIRKAEIFINNRGTLTEDAGSPVFLFAEFIRQVTQGARQGSVGDYMVATRLQEISNGEVIGRQRVAVFLQPQDPAYFDAGSNATAVFDYNLRYSRDE